MEITETAGYFANVRYWHKADIHFALHMSALPKADMVHVADMRLCLFFWA